MTSDHVSAKGQLVRAAQTLCLFVIVAAVALRPLILESYDSAGNSITRAVEALADPSPVRTLAFDLIILTASCIWLFTFAFDGGMRYRRTGLEFGLSLLAVAGGISCYFAGNKRLAMNGTIDWLCLPILTITLVQLLRTNWQRRLVLAAILATACVQAAQCYDQHFFVFADTIQRYESGREEFWARQGVDLDSTTVDAFERRLHADEASGFFAHSNVAGAYLMLCAFAAIGVIASSWIPAAVGGTQNEGDSPNPFRPIAQVASVFLVFAIAGAVFLTGSLGAMVAGAVGAALLLLAWSKRDWIGAHRRRVFWISWCVVLIGVAAVIGHGLYHNSLPGWSLTFRWQYWKASAGMIADHFWTGVGRENFGRHYTLYKDIASPEEVSNPHNLFVQAAAEWGIPGLLAVLTMIVGVTLHAARKSSTNQIQPNVKTNTSTKTQADHTFNRSLMFALFIGAAVVLGRSMLLGTSDPNYVYYCAVTTAIVWLPAFLLFFQIGNGSEQDRPGILTLSLAAGLFAFLLQDMIGFALFIPASATTFFALLALWLSYDDALAVAVAEQGILRRRFFAACTFWLTLAVFNFAFLPVYRAASWMALGRSTHDVNDTNGDESKITAFIAASAFDRLDPTPYVEKARLLSAGAPFKLQFALESLSQAIVRDPYNAGLRRQQAQFYLYAAERSHKPNDYLNAVAAAKTALSFYPADPAGLVSLADMEMKSGKQLQSKELLLSAKSHYEEALALDEKRLSWETIQRFRPRVVAEIQAKIHDIQSTTPDQ